jgi:hypothetical protein
MGYGLGNVVWAHPIAVPDGVPAVGADARAVAMQLVWFASAPNHVAPVVIQTNRQEPFPLVLSEYAARVTLPAEDVEPPGAGACPATGTSADESATLTDLSLVVEPEVNFTDGSSNSRDEALIPE